jgi:hypothetical protein
MSLEAVVVDGVMGALGGGIAWVVTRGLTAKNPGAATIRAALVTGVVVAAGVVGHHLVAPRVEAQRVRASVREAGVALFGNPHTADVYADAMVRVSQHPRFMDRLEAAKKGPKADLAVATANPTQAAAAALSASGMMRLPYAELATALETKHAMAVASPGLCAGFWKGDIPQADFSTQLKRLSEAQQMQWVQTTIRAMTLELDSTAPPPKIPAAKVGEAIRGLAGTLAPAEQATLNRALTGGLNASAADGCAAFRLLAERNEPLPPATRETIVRMLMTPDAVGD